ncbi:YybH family protein [Telluria aromaticivorans]|uniref:Nuclear transport factor 2 family protein n=1 Tax=Telluria aromaticivorans TaxID=2725995 RepID=A0A7Y2P1U0_9BURK|nr:hypothetical protein [Telluria aromaticivorans]NNG25573.1 nuclear transport factor 2 family protein [Telluria aromaticivorans]
MKSILAASALALGLLLATPPALAQAPAADKQQIDAIVETFRTSIIKKDTAAFMQLFLHEAITWTGVVTDTSIERLYANRPDPKLKRPAKYRNSSPRKFIENIAKDHEQIEETFANLRIDGDGDVAQVWFDYSFVASDYKQNWGKESWQLVRTDAGWKIAAVVWSMEFNPVPPAPKSSVK